MLHRQPSYAPSVSEMTSTGSYLPTRRGGEFTAPPVITCWRGTHFGSTVHTCGSTRTRLRRSSTTVSVSGTAPPDPRLLWQRRSRPRVPSTGFVVIPTYPGCGSPESFGCSTWPPTAPARGQLEPEARSRYRPDRIRSRSVGPGASPRPSPVWTVCATTADSPVNRASPYSCPPPMRCPQGPCSPYH